MSSQSDLVNKIAKDFTLEFISNPYLCYTEHGLHALFYTKLFNALPPDQRFTTWNNQEVCVIQKEYPTAGNLGKPQRQHWDIAVIKTPPSSIVIQDEYSYDYLKLSCVVEFGMNETKKHLIGDLERLNHQDANVELGFIIHLYRLSKSGVRFSRRDWPAHSKRILSKDEVATIGEGRAVEIYYGLFDSTGTRESSAWLIYNGIVEQLK
jgi:hypothetical protein